MKKSALKFTLLTTIIFSILLLNQNFCTYADNPITNYKFDVNFDEASKLLVGTEDINYTNNYGKPLDSLVLHLYPDSYNTTKTLPSIGDNNDRTLDDSQIGNITLSSVKINDNSVKYIDDKQVLKIKLDTPLENGNQIKIKINFTVKIPSGTDRMGYKNDVYSVTNWYPIMSIYDPNTQTWDENEFNPIGESNYSDTSDYEVTIHTPKDIITATTGEITSNTTTNDTKTINIISHKTRDFVFMMSKYYRILTTTVDGVKINSFYIYDGKSPDSPALGKKMLDVVTDSFKFYNEVYGKYPYPELTIAETYLAGGAMEYPALLQMGKYEAISKSSLDDHSSWLEDAAAHETGHQWWYVAVGDNEFKEPMMDESINTYSTAYYFEKRYGKYNHNGLLMQIHNNLVKMSTNPIASSVDKFTSWNDYSNVIYSKGPELFEDIRTRLGDDTMLKVLKTYFSRFEFKNGSIKDFEAVLGEIGGNDIETYFDTAVHSPSYYPTNLEITPSERKHIGNLYTIDDIKNLEESKGLTLSSMLLRGMEGEKVDIVVPSKITGTQSEKVLSYTKKLRNDLNNLFDVPVNIIKDTAVNSSILKDNLIVIGNLKDNSLLNSTKNNLPIKESKTNTLFKKYSLPSKNLSGTFLIKNPKDSKKLMLVVYWMDNPVNYDLILDNSDQFIINYGESREIRGQI